MGPVALEGARGDVQPGVVVQPLFEVFSEAQLGGLERHAVIPGVLQPRVLLLGLALGAPEAVVGADLLASLGVQALLDTDLPIVVAPLADAHLVPVPTVGLRRRPGWATHR